MATQPLVRLRVVPERDALVIQLCGRLWHENGEVGQTMRLCDAAQTLTGCRHLLLDLSRVQAITGLFIGRVVEWHRRRPLVCCAATQPVLEVLQLVRIDRLIRFVPTVEKALAGLPLLGPG